MFNQTTENLPKRTSCGTRCVAAGKQSFCLKCFVRNFWHVNKIWYDSPGWNEATESYALLTQVGHFRAVFCRFVVWELLQFSIADRKIEAISECTEWRQLDILGIVSFVLSLAGIAEAVALDGLGQNHSRSTLVIHSRVIGRINFLRIMAAATNILHRFI